MDHLKARIRYLTPGFWIHPDAIGWSRRFQHSGHTVEIALPRTVNEFTAGMHETDLDPVPCIVSVPVFSEPNWDSRTVAIQIFCVSVFFDGALSRNNGAKPTPEFIYAAHEQYKIAQPIAEEVAHNFLKWIRARSRQESLGLIAEPPEQYGRGGLYFADTEEGAGGFGPNWSITTRSSKLRLEVEELDAIGASLDTGDAIPVSDELLADAWHLTASEAPDLQRAIIVSCIAIETRTEQVMRARVAPARSALLQMLMHRTSSPQFILNDVMMAAFQVGLNESDSTLNQQLRELVQHRNSIIHEGVFAGGVIYSGSPARVAQEIFTWLDQNVPTTAEN